MQANKFILSYHYAACVTYKTIQLSFIRAALFISINHMTMVLVDAMFHGALEKRMEALDGQTPLLPSASNKWTQVCNISLVGVSIVVQRA